MQRQTRVNTVCDDDVLLTDVAILQMFICLTAFAVEFISLFDIMQDDFLFCIHTRFDVLLYFECFKLKS